MKVYQIMHESPFDGGWKSAELYSTYAKADKVAVEWKRKLNAFIHANYKAEEIDRPRYTIKAIKVL